MKNVIRILFIAVVIVFGGLYLYIKAHAAPLYTVPALPAGKCADVGTISGMVKEQGPAGTTYFANREGSTIQSPLSIAAPFMIAMYDADGAPSTDVSLLNHGAEVWAHSFKTGNDEWSATFTVTASVDAIALTLPRDHASTHLCLIAAPKPTETPTATATPTNVQTSTPTPQTPVATATATLQPTNTPVALVADLRIEAGVSGYQNPTGLTPQPEPIHTAQLNDGVPVVPVGAMVVVSVSITNRGNTAAEDVSLEIVSDGITQTLEIGSIQPGGKVTTQYTTIARDGLTVATLTAHSATMDTDPGNNVQSVLWMAGDDGEVCGQMCDNAKVFLPLIQR
jgi:hypothetical protein